MNGKEILGIIAVIIPFFGYAPYIINIFKGKNHPHVFSWFIWFLLTAIAFAAQLSDNAGPGSWSMGAAAGLCLLITVLAFKKSEHSITKTDVISFILALAAIAIWAFTKSPFYSVIFISIADIIGYIPTFRKSYARPFSEDILLYLLANIKFIISLFALTNLSFITAFYTIVVMIVNFIFIGMVLIRRKITATETD